MKYRDVVKRPYIFFALFQEIFGCRIYRSTLFSLSIFCRIRLNFKYSITSFTIRNESTTDSKATTDSSNTKLVFTGSLNSFHTSSNISKSSVSNTLYNIKCWR